MKCKNRIEKNFSTSNRLRQKEGKLSLRRIKSVSSKRIKESLLNVRNI
jgi:hypothetical protein